MPRAERLAVRLDHWKAAAFAQRMIDVIEDGALVLLISVGHRTGLFDAMANRQPSTAAEIAEAACLSEGYVREWLSGMVASGIVLREVGTALYVLPVEHSASLSHTRSRYNLAAVAQRVTLAACCEDRVVERFRGDGVVPYSACPCFRHLLMNGSRDAVVSALLDSILPLVPGLVARLAAGAEVLDIGCGNGRALNLMARIFPRSRFHGYGESESEIDRASYHAFTLGLNNVDFRVGGRSGSLGRRARYDLALDFDGIHDQTAIASVVREVGRVLRPGGVFLMQESAASGRLDESQRGPTGRALRSIARIREMSLSPGGDTNAPDAAWGEVELRSLLRAAGFQQVCVRRLTHHVQNSYFIATRR